MHWKWIYGKENKSKKNKRFSVKKIKAKEQLFSNKKEQRFSGKENKSKSQK